MLLLLTNAELLTHQNYNNYNWQCYLNRTTCSMWAYFPRIFTETMVRTIQCQVVSYNGWKAHGFRLIFTLILGKDSRCTPHISSTRTRCQKWQECILVFVCRPCYCFQHLQNCRLTNKSCCWVCPYFNSSACSNCKAVSQRKIKKVAQEHLAASAVMPVVRFTCCERLSKLETRLLLQDRSSCQFGELFRNHKLVFTGPVWIAGHSSQQMQNC